MRPATARAWNSSSETPYIQALWADWRWTTCRSRVRETVTAVNIDVSTPIISTRAKPLMVDEPPKYRIEAVIRLDTFESRIEFQARLKPASTAETSVLPARSSSLVRSKIRILASTAMPTDSTKPAIPASVSVTGTILNIARTTTP